MNGRRPTPRSRGEKPAAPKIREHANSDGTRPKNKDQKERTAQRDGHLSSGRGRGERGSGMGLARPRLVAKPGSRYEPRRGWATTACAPWAQPLVRYRHATS